AQHLHDQKYLHHRDKGRVRKAAEGFRKRDQTKDHTKSEAPQRHDLDPQPRPGEEPQHADQKKHDRRLLEGHRHLALLKQQVASERNHSRFGSDASRAACSVLRRLIAEKPLEEVPFLRRKYEEAQPTTPKPRTRSPDRGREGFRLPALRTARAVFPHTALQSVVSSSGMSRALPSRV